MDRWQLTGSVLTFYWQLTGSLLAAYIARRCQPPNSWPAEQRMRPGGTQPSNDGNWTRYVKGAVGARHEQGIYIAFREIFGKLSGSRSKPLETSQDVLRPLKTFENPWEALGTPSGKPLGNFREVCGKSSTRACSNRVGAIWYQSGTNLVNVWYQSGTNLGPIL